LAESKGKRFGDLSEEDARSYFKKFIKAYNSGELSSRCIKLWSKKNIIFKKIADLHFFVEGFTKASRSRKSMLPCATATNGSLQRVWTPSSRSASPTCNVFE
jgi:hypothetical protein